jgi:hypothetical protein
MKRRIVEDRKERVDHHLPSSSPSIPARDRHLLLRGGIGD